MATQIDDLGMYIDGASGGWVGTVLEGVSSLCMLNKHKLSPSFFAQCESPLCGSPCYKLIL